MSTRAMYTFFDETIKSGYHVYKHHDGYPTGAAEHIERARPHAWPLGRFEADEFAAAFVAGNKSPYINQELELLRKLEAHAIHPVDALEELEACRRYARNAGGGVRLMHSGSVYAVAPPDIAYRYEITSKKGELYVACYSTNFWKTRTAKNEKLEFEGTLEAFKAWALKGEDA